MTLMTIMSHPAAVVPGSDSEDDTYSSSQNDRAEADNHRDSRSDNDTAEHVSAQVVRSQGVADGGCGQEFIALGIRVIGGRQPAQQGAEDENDNDYEADHRSLVAPEPPGEVAEAAPVLAPTLKFCLDGVLSQLADVHLVLPSCVSLTFQPSPE